MQNNSIISSTVKWVNSFVVGNNLCPFAKRELVNNKVRFIATDVDTEEQLLVVLKSELEFLECDVMIETTLLIHPHALVNFYDYNQFLNHTDNLLVEMKLQGVYQIASFHPNYQFGGTDPSDVENYTNRSPYPMLHLLRENSLEKAIANYSDVNEIPIRNIEKMKSMDRDELDKTRQTCIKE